MIEFTYIFENQLFNEDLCFNWLRSVILSEDCLIGELNYVFCNDSYLLNINQKFLKHDNFTDIITFDYSIDNLLSGDIFISTERVMDNAKVFDVPFDEELRRVMAHGVLHLVGYGDKEPEDIVTMRAKEEEKMKLFHVEQ